MRQCSVKYLLITIFVLSVFFNSSYAQSEQFEIDSLKSEVLFASEDTTMVRLFEQIGRLYRTSNTDSALSFFEKSTLLSEKKNYQEGIARGYFFKGFTFYQIEEFEKSFKCYLKSLEEFEQLKDSLFIGSIYTNLGILYSLGYDKQTAVDYYIKSLEITSNRKDSAAIAANLNNIGLIYQQLQNFEKAIEYYSQTLAIDLESGNADFIAGSYVNIGSLFLDRKLFHEAYNNLKQAYVRFPEIRDADLKIQILANLGEYYLEIQNPDSALIFIKESLDVARKNNRKRTLAYNYFLAGRYYMLENDLENSISHFIDALLLSDSLNVVENNEEVYKYLSYAYTANGDYKNAYESLNKSYAINDSLQMDQQAKILNDFEKQKELVRIQNEFQLEQIKKQNEQEKKSIQLKFQLYVSITASVFLMIIVFIVVKNTRNKTKANAQLEERENELKILNNTKDKFFSIIAHDLRNPFNLLLGFSELLKEDDQFTRQSETHQKIVNSMHKTAEQTYSLLENLLAWARSQSGHMKIEPSEFLISEVLKDNVGYYQEIAKSKNISIYYLENKTVRVFADFNMINLVVRNMLDNAVKFTNNYGSVYVEFDLKPDEVKICVRDTGIGISEADQKKLFKIDNSFKNKGTANESGTGLGLILCHEFVQKNNGVFELTESSSKGSTFCLSLPRA